MSTDAIDNLQKQKDPKDDPNFAKFFASFGKTTGIIIGFVVLGSIGLYMTKVADSGILPTDATKDIPYVCNPTGNTPNFTDKVVEMNIVREYGMKGLAVLLGYKAINSYSQQATFDKKAFDKSFNGGWIKTMTVEANTDKPPSDYTGTKPWEPSNLTKWRSDVTNEMVSTSFKIINSVFGGFGYLPEWAVMFIFGLVGSSFLPFFSVFNICISIWKHFSSLFKQGFNLTKGLPFLKRETNGELDNKWADVGFLWRPLYGNDEQKYLEKTPLSQDVLFIFKWIFITLGLMLYFICSMFFFSPVYLTFYTVYKSLTAKYKLKKEFNFSGDSSGDTTGPKGLLSFIKDTFIYKRTYLVFLSIINLFMASNTYLGTYYFIAVIIAVIMAIVFCDVLVSTKPDNDNTLIKRTPKKEDEEEEDEDNPENDDIDNDQCNDTTDIIGKYKTEIAEQVKQIQDKQLDIQKLFLNIQGSGKSIDELKSVQGFPELQRDVNALAKAYFNCDAMNTNTILIERDIKFPLQIQQKLRTQLRDLMTYNKLLGDAYDKCNKSFNAFNQTNQSNQPNQNNTQTPFIKLMSDVSTAEGLIYTIRPSILDDALRQIQQQFQRKLESNTTSSDSNADTSSDSNADTSSDSNVKHESILNKNLGFKSKRDEIVATGFGPVLMLEQSLKKIPQTILTNTTDVLTDLLLGTSKDSLISNFDNVIEGQIQAVKTDQTLGQIIGGEEGLEEESVLEEESGEEGNAEINDSNEEMMGGSRKHKKQDYEIRLV